MNFSHDKFDAEKYVDDQMQIMDERGVRLLVGDLADYRRVSADEMRKSVFANYTAFIGTSKEIAELEVELQQMKNLLSVQTALIHSLAADSMSNDNSNSTSAGGGGGGSTPASTTSSVTTAGTSSTFAGASSSSYASSLATPQQDEEEDERIWSVEVPEPTEIEKYAEALPDILDILIAERKVDRAIELLEQGQQIVQLALATAGDGAGGGGGGGGGRGGGGGGAGGEDEEILSADAANALAAAIAERRAWLMAQLEETAQQAAVRGQELRQAVGALYRLGETECAHQLLLGAYGERIRSGSRLLRPRGTSFGGAYTAALAQVSARGGGGRAWGGEGGRQEGEGVGRERACLFLAHPLCHFATASPSSPSPIPLPRTLSCSATDSARIFASDPACAADLLLWAQRETEFCVSLLKRHVLSSAAAAGGLHAAAECVRIALGHCRWVGGVGQCRWVAGGWQVGRWLGPAAVGAEGEGVLCLAAQRHVLSSAAAAGGLLAAAECVRIALGHCRLLEEQGLTLSPVLSKLVRPSVEEALEFNIIRIEDSVATMVAVDDWVLLPLPHGAAATGRVRALQQTLGPGLMHLRLSSSGQRFYLLLVVSVVSGEWLVFTFWLLLPLPHGAAATGRVRALQQALGLGLIHLRLSSSGQRFYLLLVGFLPMISLHHHSLLPPSLVINPPHPPFPLLPPPHPHRTSGPSGGHITSDQPAAVRFGRILDRLASLFDPSHQDFYTSVLPRPAAKVPALSPHSTLHPPNPTPSLPNPPHRTPGPGGGYPAGDQPAAVRSHPRPLSLPFESYVALLHKALFFPLIPPSTLHPPHPSPLLTVTHQDLVEDILPVISLQLFGRILDRLASLFESYVALLQKALPSPSDDDDEEEDGGNGGEGGKDKGGEKENGAGEEPWQDGSVRTAEDEQQQLALLGNASALADDLLPRLAQRLTLAAGEEGGGGGGRAGRKQGGADPDRRLSAGGRGATGVAAAGQLTVELNQQFPPSPPAPPIPLTRSYTHSNAAEHKEWRRRLQKAVDKLRDVLCSCLVAEFMYGHDGQPILTAHQYLHMDAKMRPTQWALKPLPSPPFQALYMALHSIHSTATYVLGGRDRVVTLLLMRLAEWLMMGLMVYSSFWDELENAEYALGPTGLQQLVFDMYFVMQVAKAGKYSSRAMRKVAEDSATKAIVLYTDQTGGDPNSLLQEDWWYEHKCVEAIEELAAAASPAASPTDSPSRHRRSFSQEDPDDPIAAASSAAPAAASPAAAAAAAGSTTAAALSPTIPALQQQGDGGLSQQQQGTGRGALDEERRPAVKGQYDDDGGVRSARPGGRGAAGRSPRSEAAGGAPRSRGFSDDDYGSGGGRSEYSSRDGREYGRDYGRERDSGGSREYGRERESGAGGGDYGRDGGGRDYRESGGRDYGRERDGSYRDRDVSYRERDRDGYGREERGYAGRQAQRRGGY
ncbi:unnamed protein product [Closterium sp. NIES-53]